MKKLIIFTDLDGTLLDNDTYSFNAALPALNLIKKMEIPLIVCSSKTRAEIECYRKKLDNKHPFISENGGGIFIPKGYFNSELLISNCEFSEEEDYQIIGLGAKYSALRKAIKELREEGFNVRGFGDMSIREIADITGLSFNEARMAKKRDFDEPFIYSGEIDKLPMLLESIAAKGFNYTQGKYFHILGNSDKGKAVSILTDLYKSTFDSIATVGVGDSLNDIPMLEKVDLPVIVQKPEGNYISAGNIKAFIRADGIGPEGWNKTVMVLLQNLST